MTDLFSTKPSAPLAELLRPKSLSEVVGQSHLLGPGKPLQLAFAAQKLHSFILWGPPGVGKTTLAKLAATAMKCEFLCISAVSAGVKEIREAMNRAQYVLDQYQRPTVLFIDEVHRFNKSQQDALLPHLESGLVTLIGATTECPALEVNPALLSRAQVYNLQPLSEAELTMLFDRARGTFPDITFSQEAVQLLTRLADGDARRFVNLLEQCCTMVRGAGQGLVDVAFLRATVGPQLRRFDKQGQLHYEQLSAFHKSIRGSQPDAALYWMARMLDGGADPKTLARRMIVIASEDIGNADPRALQVATDAAQAYERLGLPEGELALAQAAVYLSVAAKSNAVYMAWKAAKAQVRYDESRAVPMHLRNAPAPLMKELGFKAGYRYAHDEPDAYAAGQTYFPDGLPEEKWYTPAPRGLEIKIGEKLEHLRSLDAQAAAHQVQPRKAP